MIRKIDGKFAVLSLSGKVLSTHSTKKAALRQLRAIEANKKKRGTR